MRVIERFLALLVAIAVVGGAVLLALEVIWAGLSRPPLVVKWHGLYDAAGRDAWPSAPVRIIAIIAIAIGLVLLVIELKPRRAKRLRLTDLTEGVDAALTRKALRNAMVRSAKEVDGIRSVNAKVSRRKASVHAVSRLGEDEGAGQLQGELTGHLEERLEQLQLRRPPRVRASVSARSGGKA